MKNRKAWLILSCSFVALGTALGSAVAYAQCGEGGCNPKPPPTTCPSGYFLTKLSNGQPACQKTFVSKGDLLATVSKSVPVVPPPVASPPPVTSSGGNGRFVSYSGITAR